MASIIYTSFWNDLASGAIDLDTDTIKALITTSSYAESKAHNRRDDITNEVVGAGYSTGGVTVTCSVATVGNDTVLTLGAAAFTGVTVTGRKLVYYKSRGGAASADELIAVNDQGSDFSFTAGDFTIQASTITIPNG